MPSRVRPPGPISSPNDDPVTWTSISLPSTCASTVASNPKASVRPGDELHRGVADVLGRDDRLGCRRMLAGRST